MSLEASCSEEASFLKARLERTARQNDHRRRKTHDLHDFWDHLRRKLASWKERLDDAVVERVLTKAAQRVDAQLALEALSEELTTLRKECLAKLEMLDFPATDVRLLHEEFLKHSAFLDQAKKQVCPRSKFVFKRYRAAMQRQKEEKGNEDSSSTISATAKENQRTEVPIKFGGILVSGHAHKTIIVEPDGVVAIHTDEAPPSERQAGDEDTQSSQNASSSILLQNLERCTVILTGSFQAVQIQNVREGRVEIAVPIGGACHVSSCDHLHLRSESHQLRIHDSYDLVCSVRVGSGPILEDCARVTFHYDPNDDKNYVPEAKDFNWLRSGVPSPNFSLVALNVEHSNDASKADQTNCSSRKSLPSANTLQVTEAYKGISPP